MSRVKAYYEILVHDKNGKLLRKTRRRKSKSFVIGFLGTLWGQYQSATVAVVDTGGLSRGVDILTDGAIQLGDGASLFGIVVGTGTTTPTNSDNKLATQITHGTGAGQLSHGSHSFTDPAVVGTNVDAVVSRAFYNGSGATITVREIGIYVRADTTWYFCIIRDVLAAAVSVANTETLTVQYTFRTTV